MTILVLCLSSPTTLFLLPYWLATTLYILKIKCPCHLVDINISFNKTTESSKHSSEWRSMRFQVLNRIRQKNVLTQRNKMMILGKSKCETTKHPFCVNITLRQGSGMVEKTVSPNHGGFWWIPKCLYPMKKQKTAVKSHFKDLLVLWMSVGRYIKTACKLKRKIKIFFILLPNCLHKDLHPWPYLC